MTTILHEPSRFQAKPAGRCSSFVPEMWASLAIAVMWLSVLFTAVYGPNIVSTSVAGDHTTIFPSAVAVALFAFLGTGHCTARLPAMNRRVTEVEPGGRMMPASADHDDHPPRRATRRVPRAIVFRSCTSRWGRGAVHRAVEAVRRTRAPRMAHRERAPTPPACVVSPHEVCGHGRCGARPGGQRSGHPIEEGR